MTDHSTAGHVLRSRLLDKFAQIESWAVACLATSKQPIPNAPLGQKVEALAQLCRKTPPAFKSAKKIVERLERLKPYQELRAAIVHAQLEVLNDHKSGAHFCFRNVAQTGAPSCYRPVVLSTQDFEAIIRDVAKVGNELKQMTAVTPNPPSPPPPLQAAAAGL